ncbi:acyl-homoserine-lactone synthase [Halomonas sp. KM-1]|uniref:acyl-homoserine-lactone synthase n=1 Tax=Halomonas sp. KM-1 TaxID=590061 RepID=UPI00130E7836|nr:acyl-homoserine-lactone synthase [Halomonas sp. KM-1]
MMMEKSGVENCLNVLLSNYSDIENLMLEQIFSIRKISFIDRRGWCIDSYDGGEQESDKYDDDLAYYIYVVEGNKLTGCVRLRPSLCSTLLSQTFSCLRAISSIEAVNKAWEASRFCLLRPSAPEGKPLRVRGGLDKRTLSMFIKMIEFSKIKDIDFYEVIVDQAMLKIINFSGWEYALVNEDKIKFGAPVFYVHLHCNSNSLSNLKKKLLGD